jgi:hypothetical protein
MSKTHKGIVCKHCERFLDFSYGTSGATAAVCLYCHGYVEIREDLLVTMDTRNIDYDEWGYFTDHDSGIGIVVNHFRDEGDPLLNVYVVPKDKVANNDWHSDMEDITISGEE